MNFTNKTCNSFSCSDQFKQIFTIGTVKKTIWTGEGLEDVRGTISLVSDAVVSIFITVKGVEKTIELGNNDKSNPYIITCNNLEKIEAQAATDGVELSFNAMFAYE